MSKARERFLARKWKLKVEEIKRKLFAEGTAYDDAKGEGKLVTTMPDGRPVIINVTHESRPHDPDALPESAALRSLLEEPKPEEPKPGFFASIKEAWRAGQDDDARKHPPKVAAPPSTCDTCGSADFDLNFSNSHARCRQCGTAMRKDLAQWETLPQSAQRELTYVRSGFGKDGGVVINELALDGRLVGSRPATKQDQQAAPKPVAFCGVRARPT